MLANSCENFPWIWTDLNRLRQILYFLAVHAMPKAKDVRPDVCAHRTDMSRNIQKNPPFHPEERVKHGASSRTRTDDLRITNALLYQLSHTSSFVWPERTTLQRNNDILAQELSCVK